MKVRTYIGFLAVVALVVWASYLTHQNRDLMYRLFRIGDTTEVPLYFIFIALFLLGFLPTGTSLLARTIRAELRERQERKAKREEKAQRATFQRGVDFLADGQPARAVASFEELLADRPDDFVPLLHYGEALRALGRSDEALAIHRKASALYPQSVAILHHLIADYEARGDAEVAGEIRARILRDFPGFGVRALRHDRDQALARRDWKSAAVLQQRIEGPLRDAGDEASLATERGVSLGLRYQAAVTALEEDRVDVAITALQELVTAEPRFIPARILLGEAELVRDREAAAIDAWRRGYAEVGSPVFLQRIEDHFIENSEPERALETFRDLQPNAKSDLLPRFFLGRLYHRLELHDEALRVLEGLGDRIHSSPTYHFVLGRIHQRRGETGRAAASYRRAIEELGLESADYVCRVCRQHYGEWTDRCDRCGAWNSIELDFEEERVSLGELGVIDVPVGAATTSRGSGRSPTYAPRRPAQALPHPSTRRSSRGLAE